MITKEQVLEAIRAMPEDTFENLDVLMERLVLLETIQQAEEDIEAGRIYTNEQMKEILQLWSQSSGQKLPTTT
jgi:ribosomal protein L16/L10AE